MNSDLGRIGREIMGMGDEIDGDERCTRDWELRVEGLRVQ